MSSEPNVTAIVTCYNLERYIASGIESILAQSANASIREIIVVDDGSKDLSRERIQECVGWDPRIQTVFKENGGASSARNAGLARATAPYIAFLDGDDLWHEEKLESHLEAAAAFPRAGLYVGDFIEVNEATNSSRVHWVHDFSQDDPDTLRTLFVFGGPILPSTSLIRRSAFETCGGFNENQKYSNDAEMWLRLAREVTFQRVPGIVATKRDIPNSISSNFEARVQARRDLTQRVLAWRPDLAAFAHRRNMKTEIEAGLACLELGDQGAARRYFRKALRLAPGEPVAWFYVLVSLIPGDPRRRFEFVKGLTERLRQKRKQRRVAG